MPPTSSLAANCQPISTISTMPSSTTRLVEANMNTLRGQEVGPPRRISDLDIAGRRVRAGGGRHPVARRPGHRGRPVTAQPPPHRVPADERLHRSGQPEAEHQRPERLPEHPEALPQAPADGIEHDGPPHAPDHIPCRGIWPGGAAQNHDMTTPAAGVWKNQGRLADGREIIYYDEAPDLGRAAIADTRDLSAEAAARDAAGSGQRYDPLQGEWVLLAAQRQDRTFLPSAERLPALPVTAGPPGRDPGPGLRRRGVREPVPGPARPGRPLRGGLLHPRPRGLFAEPEPAPRPYGGRGVGRPDRGAGRRCPAIEQVYCFENRGEEIGVTLPHPHGQIYAYPFVTPRTARMLAQARRLRADTAATCSTTWWPSSCRTRPVVAPHEHWTAFVPFAARWPFEVHLLPARAGCPTCGARRLPRGTSSAICTWTCCGRLDRAVRAPMPYIAAWHQAPAGPRQRASSRCTCELMSLRRGRRQAEVPGRHRVGDGRLDQRRAAGGRRRGMLRGGRMSAG